jgi:hypothetical protein
MMALLYRAVLSDFAPECGQKVEGTGGARSCGCREPDVLRYIVGKDAIGAAERHPSSAGTGMPGARQEQSS